MDHRWPPLTAALKDPQSPVRRFLDQRFPNVRDLQRRYRQEVGPIVMDESDVNAGTLGGAFDWLVRFLVHPQPDLHLAHLGANLTGSRAMARASGELAALLNVHDRGAPDSAGPAIVFLGPMPASEVEPELLTRGCWALALLTEVFRAGLRPGSPLLSLDTDAVTAEHLLALAPDSAVRQLGQLRTAAERALLPVFSKRHGPWALGPTFDGSTIMNADADLIAAGLLLEIKTSLGTKRKYGARQGTLDRQTILQLLGYTLLDFSDNFRLTEFGLYSARYAHLATWNLRQLLEELADRRVDLAAERAAFRKVLLAGSPSSTTRGSNAR